MLALTFSIPKNFQRLSGCSIEIESPGYVNIPNTVGSKWLFMPR
jgi:hypothetical protein